MREFDGGGVMALRIAFCDDEATQLALTDALLREYGLLHPELALRAFPFSSGAALLEQLRTGDLFDIYLLDVIMPGENGIELGLKIREIDQGGRIIYLSSSPDFAVDSYLPKASSYLLKPVDWDLLFRTLDFITENWLQEHQSFVTVKTRGGLQRLPIRSIVYGELVGRCIQYHLADGSAIEGTSLRGSFRDAAAPLLAHDRFALCSASFFVNLSFVEMIDSSGLRLVNGGVVPLSRTMRTEVTNQWLDYHLKGGKTP